LPAQLCNAEWAVVVCRCCSVSFLRARISDSGSKAAVVRVLGQSKFVSALSTEHFPSLRSNARDQEITSEIFVRKFRGQFPTVDMVNMVFLISFQWLIRLGSQPRKEKKMFTFFGKPTSSYFRRRARDGYPLASSSSRRSSRKAAGQSGRQYKRSVKKMRRGRRKESWL